MLVNADAEVLRLRAALRDLVALSTIPATWVGREPPAVAAGLADALIELLQVDFASVHLCDPGGAGAVDVVRGSGWVTFPQWLERHLAAGRPLAVREIIPDVDGGESPCRGVVHPVGVDAEGGLVAVACERTDFPTETEQLLLSLAANEAATAFQRARLMHERRRAEEELRGARNQLEVKVEERTAELRRSEAYLAEAQRIAHTGSFALQAPSWEPTHSSDEHSRLYGFDPEQELPSLEAFMERIHPEDRAKFAEALERGTRDAASFDVEFRVALPGSPVKHLRALAHPVRTASGELEEFLGTVIDVTERKRAEEERQAQLWFLESMDAINRAIQGNGELERMMGDVLDAVLGIFGCDRAWLMYPCDPALTFHRVRMERTRPEYKGAFDLGVDIPNDPEVAGMFATLLHAGGPVRFDPESGNAPPSAPAERFAVRSMIAVAIFPKVDRPYLFGLHQCSHPRAWTSQEERLFQEIGRRLADALDTLLMLRDVREAHRIVKESRDELRALAQEQAALRRVATLVARGVPTEAVFAAVAEEVGRLVGADGTTILRYEPDRAGTLIARWPKTFASEIGTRVTLGHPRGESLAEQVLRTRRPARIDSYASASRTIAARARRSGVRCSAGAPIIVDGLIWGVTTAAATGPQPLAAGTESRIAAFAELLGTAIARAQSRAELTASRARIVTAADETRRRLERDLHDGVQQRLVSLGLELRAVEAALGPGDQLRAQLAQAVTGLAGALDDLVEISRGIHPGILAAGGLGPALRTLARRSAVPVELDLRSDRRLPEPVEVAAYYVVSEALTNAAKHSHASVVHVDVDAGDSIVRLVIRDDGRGGAEPDRGSGLIGLTDRVEALGGRLAIASPPGRGTTLDVTIPVEDRG